MAGIVGPPANVIRNRPITTELRELLDGAADATGSRKGGDRVGRPDQQPCPPSEGCRRRLDRVAPARQRQGGRHRARQGRTHADLHGYERVASRGIRDSRRSAWGNRHRSRHELIWDGKEFTSDSEIACRSAKAGLGRRRRIRERAGLVANSRPGKGGTIRSRRILPRPFGPNLRALDRHGTRRAVAAQGAGLGFDRARLLDEGRELTVLGLDGEWARVDLEGDGRIDGHVFAAFLGAADFGNADDGVEEPGEEEALAAARRRGGRRRGRSCAKRRASSPAPGRRSEE